MYDPFDLERHPAMNRLQRLRRLARAAILWEEALQGFWRAACWTALFCALWLLDVPAMFGQTAEILTSIAFIAGLYILLRAGMKTFRWPDSNIADRRLEQDSNAAHRPLEQIDDRLANPLHEQTRTLWHRGVDKAYDTIAQLRAPKIRPQLAGHDPRALRLLTLLLLVTGFAAAGPTWPARLSSGLFPFSLGGDGKANDSVIVWITPPEYTRLPRITVQGGGRLAETIDVPEGSIIKARVRGGIGRPVLLMGETRLPLQRIDDKTQNTRDWGIEAAAVKADDIKISQLFFPRARIPVHYIDDQPPKITLKEVKTLPKGPLQFDVTVQDDYGVSNMLLQLKQDPATMSYPLGAPVDEERAVQSPAGQETELKPLFDMTWHPWAGLPVVLELTAKDGQGHGATIPPIHMTLPERAFYHPVAKHLIELRKRLAWSPKSAAVNVAYDLEGILSHPETFGDDIVVFLSLRSAASRLIWDHTPGAAAPVVAQLWDTALRVEDGNLSLAARDLREAQEQLQSLLDDPKATPDQIAAAMEKLRGAMAAYFQELYREMVKRMAENGEPPMSPEMFGNTIDADSLAAFMEQLQSQALTGDREAARQMLSQLQQMTDRMDPSMSMEMPPQMKAMMKAMEGMHDLIQKQKDLLEETKKAAQGTPTHYAPPIPHDGPQPDQPSMGDMPPQPQDTMEQAETGKKPDTKAQQEQQEKLRMDLGQMMLDAGEAMEKIPDNMQNAEQAMRGASAALGDNNPAEAAPRQQAALDELQKGQSAMQQQMKKMMQQMTMMSFGMGSRDPLGRPMRDGNGKSLLPDASIKIPDQAQRKKVQEILKVLRRRSGELNRPDYELDYFRRLMKQF